MFSLRLTMNRLASMVIGSMGSSQAASEQPLSPIGKRAAIHGAQVHSALDSIPGLAIANDHLRPRMIRAIGRAAMEGPGVLEPHGTLFQVESVG